MTPPRGNTESADVFDPVTRYAEAVRDGEILAGPYVRLQCARHLEMLETQGAEFYWDIALAQKWIDFFPDMLTVEEDGETVPFFLLDWQVFVAGSLNGWRDADTGYRWFRKAYVEGGKGCGKSPFAAGIGLLMMVADDEQKAEVYSAAGKKEQAHILFQDAVSMKKGSTLLNRRIVESGKTPVWKLTHRQSGSFFVPISADKTKSGARVHCGLVDELHEHRDRYTVDMLAQGFKGRRQPLLFIITNSGFDKETICYEWHEHCVLVLEKVRTDPRLFSYIMALDPEDDPLADETCWLKTNPGLGITIQETYLRDQVRDANQIPGRENVVRRLNFCQWTDSDEGWMTRAKWVENEEELTEFAKPGKRIEDLGRHVLSGGGHAIAEGFEQAELYVGLDLSFQFDLTALAFCFPEGDNLLAWIEYFKPIDTITEAEKSDHVPYRQWMQNGLITGVEGKFIREEHMVRRIGEVRAMFDMRAAAYDNYAHKALRDKAVEAGVRGIPWIEHPQGFRRGGYLKDDRGRPIKGPDDKPLENPLWMPESVKALERRLVDNTILIQPSPVTRWQVSSVVIRNDPSGAGNRVFDKNKATGRIDGIVALAMAVGAAEMKLPTRDIRAFLANPVIAR